MAWAAILAFNLAHISRRTSRPIDCASFLELYQSEYNRDVQIYNRGHPIHECVRSELCVKRPGVVLHPRNSPHFLGDVGERLDCRTPSKI